MGKTTLVVGLAIAGIVGLAACSDVDYNREVTAPTPPAGTLQLTIVTTGQDLDDDGYTATLDCGCFEKVDVNDVATMAGVEPGSHMVLLTGIAVNCELDEANPRWVTVEANETAEMTFTVSCHGNR